MQIVNTASDQLFAHVSGQIDGQLFGIVTGFCIKVIQVRRHRRATRLCELFNTVPAANRQDTGQNFACDACSNRAIAKAEKRVRIKKELSDGTVRAGVKLAFEKFYIGVLVSGLRMRIRVGADTQLEFACFRQGLDQLDRIGKAFGVGVKPPAPLGGSPRSATISETPAAA